MARISDPMSEIYRSCNDSFLWFKPLSEEQHYTLYSNMFILYYVYVKIHSSKSCNKTIVEYDMHVY